MGTRGVNGLRWECGKVTREGMGYDGNGGMGTSAGVQGMGYAGNGGRWTRRGNGQMEVWDSLFGGILEVWRTGRTDSGRG